MGKREKKRGFWKTYKTGLLFITPAILMVSVFAIYPLIYTVFLSFHKYNMVSGVPRSFHGFSNYIQLISDDQFLNSIKVTLVYTFWGVFLTMIFGVLLAMILNREGLIAGVLRGISLMPMLICGVALAVSWSLMYNYSFGAINAILAVIGIPPQNFLGTVGLALPSLIVIDVWQFTPYVMILVLAGLNGIAPELYEAASIDGANKMQSFVKITLPGLRNVLITTLIMRVIDTFKTFEKPFVLTGGGPALSTDTINLHVYNTAFSSWEMGYGSAGSVVITILILALATLFMKVSNRANTD